MLGPLLDVMREEPSVRSRAAELVRSELDVDPLAASSATPGLVNSLVTGGRGEAEEASRILRALPDTSIPALVDYVQRAEAGWGRRVQAIHALWAMPEFDRSVVAVSIEEAVRELPLTLDEVQHAVDLLEGVETYDRLTLTDVLVEPLAATPADWDVRIPYLEMLWDIPGFSRVSVLHVPLEGLRSDDRGVAYTCALKILGIDRLPQDAAPALREALNHEDAGVRLWIRRALSKTK